MRREAKRWQNPVCEVDHEITFATLAKIADRGTSGITWTWAGEGSISAYQQALSAASKSPPELISKSDAKDITAWGHRRNKAAHKPTEFTFTPADIRLMVQGVRMFVRRVMG